MKQQTLEEWAQQRYPRAVASRKRQAATHERALQRKANAGPKKPTQQQLKRQRALAAAITKKKVRRAKHARKLAGV